MKLNIWEDKQDEIYFRLIQQDEDIILAEVYNDGIRLPKGIILTISSEGIHLASGYKGSLPIDLNQKVILK